jgi:putative ABC transport system permease protein
MNLLAEWLRRLAYLVHRGHHDALLRAEMESHRAMMSNPSAFGNPLLLREEARDAWGWRWLDDVLRDVRFAARTLRRSPAFTFITVLSLALATGATTAIFSVVNSVLLKPLPFAEPDRLVQVREVHPNGSVGSVAAADLEAFRAESVSFDRLSSFDLQTRLLETPAGPEHLTVVFTDRELFPLLQVEAIAGRTYGPDDPLTVAVLSEDLWVRQFGRDPSVLGRAVALSGNRWDPTLKQSVLYTRQVTVIGVMSDRFQFPFGASSVFPGALPESRVDMWAADERPRAGRLPQVVGRLKPGVTPAAAEGELDVIEKRLDVTAPGRYRAIGVRLTPLADEVLGRVHGSLWLMFGAVGLVLLAACANVANLLLARTTARMHEIVTRAALGADRLRLIRQFLAESLLLSLAGGAAGLAFALWGVHVLVAVSAATIPRAHEIALDWQAFLFLFAVCVATAILFGLAPALLASRADVQSIAKESGGRSTGSSRAAHYRDALVVAEVAVAFVLAFGVAGVVRELNRLERTDSGMIIENVITLHLTPRVPNHDYYAIEERVARLPGVRAAGLIQMVPLQNWDWIGDFNISGTPREERPKAELRSVTPGYFQALGIPVRGRVVTEQDGLATVPGILINETLARTHFANDDPIGRETDRGIIVGVAGDVRQSGLDRPPQPEIYGPINRDTGIASDLGMSLIVKTADAPEAIVPSVRAAVREVNPVLAIFNVKTMARVVADSLWELNLYRWLIGLFAALALVLSAVGLYGVISYSVTSRLREFAVRLALGSDPGALSRLVFARGARLAGLGLVLGAIGAYSLLPLLRNLPAAIAPDAATFLLIAAIITAIAFLACLLPALRVASVNPATALRHD